MSGDCRWVCNEDGWECKCRRPNGYVVLELDWDTQCRDAVVIVQEDGSNVDEIYPEWPTNLDLWPTGEEAMAACRKLADEYLSQEQEQ